MNGFFDGAKRFNLIDNSLALLALHLACVGLISSHGSKFADLNLTLPLVCCLFGAVFAVLAVFYGVVNGVPLRKLVELNEEWGEGPPVQPALKGELRTMGWMMVGFIALLCGLALAKFPVWPAGFTLVFLAFMVIAPLPLAWNRFSPLVAIIRGGLALLSMLAFVLAVSLPLLPPALAKTTQGVVAAIADASSDGAPGENGRDGISGADGDAGQVGQAGADGRNGTDAPSGDQQAEERPLGETQNSTTSGDAVETSDVHDGIRADINQLRIDMTAALTRPVEVRMGPPTVVNVPAYEPSPIPPQPAPEVTVIGFTGEPGEAGVPGAPGPVRDCKAAWAPWLRECTWVAPPEIGSRAPSSPF